MVKKILQILIFGYINDSQFNSTIIFKTHKKKKVLP